MSKKSILTSVATSMVLASVLVLSGCGGTSSSSDKLPTLGKDDPIASGNAELVVGQNGLGDTGVKILLVSQGGKTVATATVRAVTCNNKPAKECCAKKDECSITIDQVSVCGAKSTSVNKATVEADIAEARTHTQELINDAAAAGRYDDNTDMIVFGGTNSIDLSGFDSATMSLSVNMLDCGAAFLKDGGYKAGIGFNGNGNNGHIVDVYVKNADGSGHWINNIKIKDGKILLSSSDLGAVGAGTKLFFYSIKPEYRAPGSTGMSGAS